MVAGPAGVAFAPGAKGALAKTLGVPLFQEQAMRIAMEAATGGADFTVYPRFYIPYATASREAAARGEPLSKLSAARMAERVARLILCDPAPNVRVMLGALLAVAKGSSRPPRLVMIRYDGAGPNKPYLALVAVCFFWGTTYLAIRVALDSLPPLLMAGIRWSVAGTIILRTIGRREDVEDLLQETFLRVWNRVQAFDGEKGALGPWILTVAVAAAIIGFVLVVNALLGAWQELQAERQSASLRGLLRVRATVLRDAVAQEIADLEGVTEVYSVAGDADLVAMVRVREHEALADVIADRLNKVTGVTGTNTHIAFRTYSSHDLEAAFSLGLEG